MKFRKRPVVIEAVKFNKSGQWPSCVIDAYKGPTIKTLEGDMLVSDGDWIITGVNGENYPCKPDIFEKTYEEVKLESPNPTVLSVDPFSNDN